MSEYNKKYPSITELKNKAKARLPRFAFDYLASGCNEELCLARNYRDIENINLRPRLLSDQDTIDNLDISVNLLGQTYSAPFGVAPVGLQGLIWPGSAEILAKAAYKANIPFVLSTVSTASLEKIAEITHGQAWYQLYNPTDPEISDDLIKRLINARYQVMVVTVDVPSFGLRYSDIKNGLTMPPKMTMNNILQMLGHPRWLMSTACTGIPQMQTLKPYLNNKSNQESFSEFMNRMVMGKVDAQSLQKLRDKWSGKFIIKGLTNPEDIELAIKIGADGVVVSNHGGRQLDNSESTIQAMKSISKIYKNKTALIMDSGISSGPDIASSLACGADFTLLGRFFLYSVAALGKKGGDHAINVLTAQFKQVMQQLKCAKSRDLPKHLVEVSTDVYRTRTVW